MIFRKWSGVVRTAEVAAFVAYVEETGTAHYVQTPGNLGYQILTRDLGDGTSEVSTVSWWEDVEAIKAFAGEDYTRARYYPEDDRFLIGRPEFVEHYAVVEDGRRV